VPIQQKLIQKQVAEKNKLLNFINLDSTLYIFTIVYERSAGHIACWAEGC